MKKAFNQGVGTAPAPADILKAALRGDAAVMSRLIEAGADIGARNVAGHTPLMIAAARGHIEVVTALLDAGADVNALCSRGSTALAMTGSLPSPDMTELLLSRGADPLRGHAGDQKTLLRAAVSRGEEELFHALVAAGADIKYADEGKRTLLMLACDSRQPGMVKLLTDAGLDPLAEDSAWKSAADRAAKAGDAACLRPLLEAIDPAVGKKDEKLNRLLCLATEAGSEQAVGLLLEKGAKPNWDRDSNNTPLRLAIRAGSVPCVELLLRHGADPMNKAWSGSKEITDEDCAKEKGGEIEKLVSAAARKFHLPIAAEKGDAALVRELLEEGVPVDLTDRNGVTPLLLAAGNGHLEAAKVLLEHKADPNFAKESTGRTPLFVALKETDWEVQKPDTAMVDLLIASGANTNAINPKTGLTPLALATAMDLPEMASWLLKNKADPNIGYGQNATPPLFDALAKKSPDMVRALIAGGASVMLRDKAGATAYSIGKESPKADIRDIICDAYRHELEKMGASATEAAAPVKVMKTLKMKPAGP